MTSLTMSDLSPELLAQHDGWLRALVRRLVDDGQADDVVQEVWGQAMQAKMRDRKALPAWLAQVARRVAGKTVRSKQRRRAHEQTAAERAPTSTVDPAELVARVEGRQEVAKTVLNLDEPFRTVVLLRYFEDQTPEQIAKQLNIPGATVRTRLHRAHEQLRQRFQSEHGKEWRGQLAVLIAPIGAIGGSVHLPASAVAVRPKALLLFMPVVVAALVWVFVEMMATAPPPAAANGGTPGLATANETAKAGLHAPAQTERTAAPTEAPPSPPVNANNTVRIAGQIVDYAGQPLPEVEIAFLKSNLTRQPAPKNAQVVGKSDRGGKFDLEFPFEYGSLRASGELATLRSWELTGQAGSINTDEALIVATNYVQLGGIVVDENGNAATDRTVSLHIHDTVGLPIPAAGTQLERFRIKTTTDATGNFQLNNVPGFPLGEIGVGKHIARDALIPIPTQDRHDLRLVLGTGTRKSGRPTKPKKKPIATRWINIEGTVVTQGGEPIKGAHIWHAMNGLGQEVSDAQGQFKTMGRAIGNSAAIMKIVAEGFAPQQLEIWPEPNDQPSIITVRLVELVESSLAIAGKVVNEHNIPVSGLLVALADATPLDMGSLVPRYIERPKAHRHGPHAETDSRGRFRIPGVLDRPYHVRVFDEETGFAQTHGPFHPRQEWTVHIEQPRVRPEMQLHVVDMQGRAVTGAKAELQVVLVRNDVDNGFGSSHYESHVGDAHKAITDETGDCIFPNAPGGDLQILINKPGWMPTTVSHTDKINRAEVRLLRLMPFRIATHGVDDQWPSLKLYDDVGNELEVKPAWRGDHYPGTHQFGIVRGHSVVAAFPETVRRAELLDMISREVIRSMPVVVNREGITILDFPE